MPGVLPGGHFTHNLADCGQRIGIDGLEVAREIDILTQRNRALKAITLAPTFQRKAGRAELLQQRHMRFEFAA